jgi:hypothetical protein
MKIALHDNILSIRGTTVALYDYAYYLKHLYNFECIIIYNNNSLENSNLVKEKMLKEFKIFGYNNKNEIDRILIDEKCDYFFAIKGGANDGILSSVCKNLIMAVSANISRFNIHGDKYYVCSPWLSKITGIDYVSHMINLPDNDDNLRKDLSIPSDSIVFGRNGGYDSFDIQFVKDVIKDILPLNNSYYFLFQNTEKFIDHERCIFLEPSADLNFKVKFINTCDAHLHARQIGESFGLTCGEFSIKNKPVITWNGSPERNHIDTLGDKALLYNNYEDLMRLLLNFNKNKFNDWNCYQEYLPEKVINRFLKFYIDN